MYAEEELHIKRYCEMSEIREREARGDKGGEEGRQSQSRGLSIKLELVICPGKHGGLTLSSLF
jgi:hypothetical protein